MDRKKNYLHLWRLSDQNIGLIWHTNCGLPSTLLPCQQTLSLFGAAMYPVPCKMLSVCVAYIKSQVYTFYLISKIFWLCHIATTQKNWSMPLKIISCILQPPGRMSFLTRGQLLRVWRHSPSWDARGQSPHWFLPGAVRNLFLRCNSHFSWCPRWLCSLELSSQKTNHSPRELNTSKSHWGR